jgi:hypothetical protein
MVYPVISVSFPSRIEANGEGGAPPSVDIKNVKNCISATVKKMKML